MIEQSKLLKRWCNSEQELRSLRDQFGRRGEDWRKEYVDGRGWTVLWTEDLVRKVDESFGIKNAPLPFPWVEAGPDTTPASASGPGLRREAESVNTEMMAGPVLEKNAPTTSVQPETLAPTTVNRDGIGKCFMVFLPNGYEPRRDVWRVVKGWVDGHQPTLYRDQITIRITVPWKAIPKASKIMARKANPMIYDQVTAST